jgi:hypothetical protein
MAATLKDMPSAGLQRHFEPHVNGKRKLTHFRHSKTDPPPVVYSSG